MGGEIVELKTYFVQTVVSPINVINVNIYLESYVCMLCLFGQPQLVRGNVHQCIMYDMTSDGIIKAEY